jgi:hypothetical protein
MQQTVEFEGRQLKVTLSNSAAVQLSQEERVVSVEMELLFSCLIRKRVLFGHSDDVETLPGLSISFRPVMTRKCDIHAVAGRPGVAAFPIQHAERYVPKWLTIDFRKGEWIGEFGYVS